MKDDIIKEVFINNKLLEYLNNSEEDNLIEQKFKTIIAYESPLSKLHPNYNGLLCNPKIKQEKKKITNKLLSIIAADNPVSYAIYTRDNDLLNELGQRHFKSLAKRDNNF